MQSPRSAHSLHSGNKSVKSVNAIAMPNCPMSDAIDMSNNKVNDELILWSVLMVGLGFYYLETRGCLGCWTTEARRESLVMMWRKNHSGVVLMMGAPCPWAGEHFVFVASCLGPLRVNPPIYIQLHC